MGSALTIIDETGHPPPHSLLFQTGGGVLPRFLLRTTERPGPTSPGLFLCSRAVKPFAQIMSSGAANLGLFIMTLIWNSRSEEHTYELHSLMRNSYATFCMTKKKK